jgi:L-fuconolactonase
MTATSGYVDAHVHFWDVDVHRYDWLADEPGLGDRCVLADYRAATADDPPDRFLFVQAGTAEEDAGAEARWVDEMCGTEADFAGMVVWAPTDGGAGAVARHLDALDLATVRGVRRLIQGEPDGFGAAPAFIDGVTEVGRRDLVFDICITPRQLGDATVLVRGAPEARFVLDHCGKPDIAGGGFDEWQAELRGLAACHNVWCKLSGLVTEADLDRWTVADLRRYVDEALEVFGPRRLLWGSDWPVCTNAATHRRWRDASAELLDVLSGAERANILSMNATDVYRLGGN